MDVGDKIGFLPVVLNSAPVPDFDFDFWTEHIYLAPLTNGGYFLLRGWRVTLN